MKFQFVATDDPGSKLIEAFEHGIHSHVDIVLGNGLLLGARTNGGVQIRQPGYEIFTRKDVVTLKATAQQETDFLNFLMAQIGKPYDHTAIAAFAFDRDWRSPDSWFCSELAAAATEAAQWFNKALVVPANRITPRDWYMMTGPWDIG